MFETMFDNIFRIYAYAQKCSHPLSSNFSKPSEMCQCTSFAVVVARAVPLTVAVLSGMINDK